MSERASDTAEENWIDVGETADVSRRKKTVITIGDHDVLVVAHEGAFYAFQHLCIHRQRELSRGVVLNGRLVCPGHQWAFDLATGWETIKQECQPTYAVRVHGDVVQVDGNSRRVETHAAVNSE